MIKAVLSKNAEGVYNSICFEGHAGFDEFGKDIVCAAVSMLVINTVNSIEQFTEDEFLVEQDEAAGKFKFQLTSDISSDSKLLLSSLVLGLQAVEEEYGKQYIKLIL